MGKRCANLNCLRALERVLKNLRRWKDINFLKSSPRRAEVQILEETPYKPTSVCFTILTAWLVPTGSACQVWGQLVLYLLRNWLKRLHKKVRKKANSTKSCGIAWTPYSKSAAKLLPTVVTSASLSYCCRKNERERSFQFARIWVDTWKTVHLGTQWYRTSVLCWNFT